MRFLVCNNQEIKDNSMKLFKVNKTDVLVGRITGRLFACNNSCPHRGASLVFGELKGNNIYCYMHGYEYDAFSGKLVHMKSWKKEDTWVEQDAEWRKSDDLTLYPVYEKDGEIYVELPDG